MARINYPKELVKPDGRKLIAGGPRDMQRRMRTPDLPTTASSEVGEHLAQKIEELSQALKSKPVVPEGYMAPEQVDAEIRKAVEEAVKETTLAMKRISQVSAQSVEPTLQKYKVQIVELQKTNDDLTKLHSEIAKQNSDLKSKISELEVKKEEIKELEIKLAVLEQNLKGKDEMIVVLKSRTGDGASVEDPNRPKMDSVFIDPLSADSGKGLKSFIQTDDVTREEKDEMMNKVSKLKGLLGKLPVRRQED